MNIKVLVIENLRQIQIDMIHRSYHGSNNQSFLRGQGRILNLLHEGSSISRTELGEKMHMSRAALAELLGKMEKNGLITRTQSANDKRRIDITLTETGKKAAEITDVDRSALPEMLNCLDIEELNQFNLFLERIIEYNRDTAEDSLCESEAEAAEIAENVVAPICGRCTGPENCNRDYLKYGHDRPNPDYCKYADRFPF